MTIIHMLTGDTPRYGLVPRAGGSGEASRTVCRGRPTSQARQPGGTTTTWPSRSGPTAVRVCSGFVSTDHRRRMLSCPRPRPRQGARTLRKHWLTPRQPSGSAQPEAGNVGEIAVVECPEHRVVKDRRRRDGEVQLPPACHRSVPPPFSHMRAVWQLVVLTTTGGNSAIAIGSGGRSRLAVHSR